MVSALNVWYKAILRKSGPFIKAKDKATSCAVFSASNVAMKKRSRGKSGKSQGLPPHPAPPPFSPSATSTPAPAASPVHYGGLDSRKQYRQEALRQLQSSKSGSSREAPSQWFKTTWGPSGPLVLDT